MQSIEFKNNDITMAGNVFFPAELDASRTHPAIVSVHPGGGVKEQTAGLHAARLADRASWSWPSTPRAKGRAAACCASSTTR